jgi:hypothetical protein
MLPTEYFAAELDQDFSQPKFRYYQLHRDVTAAKKIDEVYSGIGSLAC